LDREYEIGIALNLPSVRRVLGRTEWRGRDALELEYIPGQTFKSYFKNPANRQLKNVLKLALNAARALETLHAAGIVHRDIAASNLLVTEDGERVVIIDLGCAAHINEEISFTFSTEAQLPYLSPEQTGRIALPVDERSDLYAFGVVLYEMLTGAPPFQAEDTPGWIHAHLARQPEPVSNRSSSIPQVVSEIALRLLAKSPDQRYQTARGLRHDMEQCLENLTSEGTIQDFALGHGDHSGRLRIPSILYGRTRGQRHLRIALEHATKGKPRLEFISGYAGVGKTALVNELRFPVAAAGGRFSIGKFDQTLQALPYAAFFESYSQLCNQILGGSPDELQSFRDRVLETLGSNAGLLLELVPELEAVIGPQPAPQPLETVASANRFTLTLLGFFHCLVTEGHPLVLFLDDLQWADSASLDLLHMIVTRTLSRHFLIICAYRDTELPPKHPLLALIENIQQEWPHVGRMALGGLTLGQATELLADALDVSARKAAPLAELIHAKTDGNPFFMRQVLETLVNEEALVFDTQSDTWQWDVSRVMALDISDNVIQLMLRKIARLPADVRRILQAASCIGNAFTLDLLRVAADCSKQALRKPLAHAVDDGLAATLGNIGRFTHDRIQQAVYQTLTTQQAQEIHLRLGRHLIERRQGPDLSLVAVRQLNLGSSLIESVAERQRLAALNLQAGRVASTSMAYGEARDFYNMGEGLLADGDDTALLYELRLRQAEASFYIGDVANSIQRLHELMRTTSDMSFRIRIYQLLIDIHTVELRTGEALAIGWEALDQLDVTIPKGGATVFLESEVEEIERMMSELDIERLAEWPEMHDDRELAIAGTLAHLVMPAYIASAPEFPFIAMEFVRRTLKGGLSRFSSYAFSVYGMLLAAVLGRYESAYRMGRLAVEIAQRPDCVGQRCRAYFLHAIGIMHWREPLEATLPVLDKGWRAGVETGDLQIASYCINHFHGNALLAGQSLTELAQSQERFAEVHRVIRQEESQQGFSMTVRLVEALRHPAVAQELPDLLIDHGGAEKVLETWYRTGNTPLLSIYYLMKCLLAMLMEKPGEALRAVEQVGPLINGILGVTWLPQHHFLYALIQADAVREGRLESVDTLGRIEGLCEQLETWAEECPDNYLPKLLLVKAEMADLAGEDQGRLLDAYDRAIDAAADANRTLDQALACERAAGYWNRCAKPLLAGLYLQRAIRGYESWGASAKVAQLLQNRTSQLQSLEKEFGSISPSGSSGDDLHVSDIHSVLKAAQTVAGELVMDRMLARLIGLVIESAGAQSGYLLLEESGKWCVVAEQRPGKLTLEVLQWRPLEDSPEIAASVVHYVARTQNTVNLADATKSTLFAADSSLVARGCKSVLCLPIINRGELAGILYLENNLATHAFTRTHTQVLQLLTTQAISSLEISRYYTRMQDLNPFPESKTRGANPNSPNPRSARQAPGGIRTQRPTGASKRLLTDDG
jgi:predicted ATPase/GAF domain-containing protein